MQKLTQAQANWLINLLKEKAYNDCYSFCQTTTVALINQCTEKEFPKFDVADVFIELEHDDSDYISLFISKQPSPDGCAGFTKEEFKQFTAGCNEIVGWIEEQE